MRYSSVSEVATGSHNGKTTGSCFRQGPATRLVMACFFVSGPYPPISAGVRHRVSMLSGESDAASLARGPLPIRSGRFESWVVAMVMRSSILGPSMARRAGWRHRPSLSLPLSLKARPDPAPTHMAPLERDCAAQKRAWGAAPVRLAQQHHIGYRQSGTQAGSGAEPVHQVSGREREKVPRLRLLGCSDVPIRAAQKQLRQIDKTNKPQGCQGGRKPVRFSGERGVGGDDGLADWLTVAD